MRILGMAIAGVVALLGAAGAAAWLYAPNWNDRQTSGALVLEVLDAPVRVVRDEYGTPYIHADSFEDAVRAQGFVAGQDRLFQLEVAKRAATGRLAEVFGAGEGDVVLNLDREARVIGFARLGARQAEMLEADERHIIRAYLEGLNAYIETRADTHPREFGLAGFAPEPWSENDLLALMYLLGWQSSANFDAELVALRVIDQIGADAFSEIAPLVVNPDDEGAASSRAMRLRDATERWAAAIDPPAAWTVGGWSGHGAGGSNNWAVSGERAGAPAAIVTNDPHLDSRILPGPWHPVGVITPDLRVVGVSIGFPGVTVGRNDHIAFGVTNAYADAVDLYVETVDPTDPNRYLEGEEARDFDTVTEVIRVRDEAHEGGVREERQTVRFTRRGPVITDAAMHQAGGAVLSARWAAAEYMSPRLGLEALMRARNVDEAIEAVETIRFVSLNFVVGDVNGRIARRASGAAPIRLRGDGVAPFPVVDGRDNWAGPIPADQMPGEIDPAPGWTGTANHMTAPRDYPYVYTSFASPAYRYRRMRQIFDQPRISAEEAWAAQYDDLNVFAQDIAPILAEALLDAEDAALRAMGEALAAWNHRDEREALAPTLFHETVRQLARLTYEDEMGADVAAAYLSNWYVWQERFGAMVRDGDARWFDDQSTAETEDLAALIRRAGAAALARLTETHGANQSRWLWGAVHAVEFQGPLRLDGWAGRLTGNRRVALSGSGETLLRGLYPFDRPFDVQWFASLRMTADLNDPDRVRAVLPGGAVGRTLNRHLGDQTSTWSQADAEIYWSFSDAAIEAAAREVLMLEPAPR